MNQTTLPVSIRGGLSIAACLFSQFPDSDALAQVHCSTETSFGIVEVYGGVTKSTHIGAFEKYVWPPLLRDLRKTVSGKTTPPKIETPAPVTGGVRSRPKKRPTGWDLILPNGRLPRDVRWNYESSPGFEIGVSLSSAMLPTFGASPARISVFRVSDFNRVRIVAPTGIGILIDPTKLLFKARFVGWGVRYDVPVWTFDAWGGRHRLLVGVGAISYRSKTLATAKSAFLNIAVHDTRRRQSPLGAIGYEFVQERQLGSGAISPRSVGLDIRAFQTDHFYTWSATLRGSVAF